MRRQDTWGLVGDTRCSRKKGKLLGNNCQLRGVRLVPPNTLLILTPGTRNRAGMVLTALTIVYGSWTLQPRTIAPEPLWATDASHEYVRTYLYDTFCHMHVDTIPQITCPPRQHHLLGMHHLRRNHLSTIQRWLYHLPCKSIRADLLLYGQVTTFLYVYNA